MPTHKISNDFIRKWNKTLAIKGYSKMSVKEKTALIEKRLKEVKSEMITDMRKEWTGITSKYSDKIKSNEAKRAETKKKTEPKKEEPKKEEPKKEEPKKKPVKITFKRLTPEERQNLEKKVAEKKRKSSQIVPVKEKEEPKKSENVDEVELFEKLVKESNNPKLKRLQGIGKANKVYNVKLKNNKFTFTWMYNQRGGIPYKEAGEGGEPIKGVYTYMIKEKPKKETETKVKKTSIKRTLRNERNIKFQKVYNKSIYTALGLPDKANPSRDEIKKICRKLQIQNHPDKGGKLERTQEINDACSIFYETINDKK